MTNYMCRCIDVGYYANIEMKKKRRRGPSLDNAEWDNFIDDFADGATCPYKCMRLSMLY